MSRTGRVPVDGVDLYYEIHGTGKPLVLLHGGLMLAEIFAPILPALAAGRQVIGVDLQSHGHYINHDGNSIHSPSKTKSGAVPAGASAQCRDGTYSFSAHRSGTCSHHGGVAKWL